MSESRRFRGSAYSGAELRQAEERSHGRGRRSRTAVCLHRLRRACAHTHIHARGAPRRFSLSAETLAARRREEQRHATL